MTKIEWVRNADESQGKTWNPITGCSHAGGPGCDMCYARRMARRLAGRHGYPEYPHHFDVTLRPDRLNIPLRRKKPTTYFVCSMSDLFHEDVPDLFLWKVFSRMWTAKRHVFQVLTKRPKRMREFLSLWQWANKVERGEVNHIWLGVSVENQATADERIPLLLQTPAAVRFVSCEPLLAEIDLSKYLHCGISWCIIGAESGPSARPMNENWVRRLVTQCKQHQVPVFYKQKIVNGKKISLPTIDGKKYTEFPQTIGRQSGN